MPQATGLVAELEASAPGTECELVPSSGGAFEVSRDGQLVFSKLDRGRFPGYQEIPELLGLV
ncbi:MAG TPA: SelT/SelW/SelH family protein [Planctomycetes bacterium]|nr:SelT/SelW/SelH family protein [Planctomycetota bacterium]